VLECLVFIAIVYTVSLTVLFLSSSPVDKACNQDNENPTNSDDNKGDIGHIGNDRPGLSETHISNDEEPGVHKLAVIVPYRDRLEEMLEFAPHLHDYLNKKKVKHKIIVVNQVDSLR